MNIGDKVQITDTIYTWDKNLANGLTGVVATLAENGSVGVIMDNGYEPMEFAYLQGKPAWTFFPQMLKVIK